MLAYAKIRPRLKRMVRANSGLYDGIDCQLHRCWRYSGKPLTSAPRDPITEPTKALTEKIRVLSSGLHFSARSACSTALKGPPPCPPPPDPPAPTLAIITARKMKARWLKKI